MSPPGFEKLSFRGLTAESVFCFLDSRLRGNDKVTADYEIIFLVEFAAVLLLQH